ncbi:MAG TPA: hypothetical protein VKV95_02080 [Terriglobia bacterium]|nr:hypothetical protein [Terriglobia bacterium]
MSTFVQWVHVSAAVLGVGGIAFLHIIILPSMRALNPDQRETLLKAVLGKFRWVSWSVILLLLISGLYNVRQYYWEVPWGRAWLLLTIKIVLAMLVFAIALGLSLPLNFLNWFRARRQMWLAIALTLAMIVILISAYLRRT